MLSKVNDISSSTLKDMKLTKMSQSVAKMLYPRAIGEVIGELLTSELSTARREEQARKMALLEKQRRDKLLHEMIIRKSAQMVREIFEEVTEEEVEVVAEVEIRKEQNLNRLTKETSQKLLESTLRSIVAQEVERELEEAQELWRSQVQELFDRLLCSRVRRMFCRWRDLVQNFKERRERLQRFPAARSSLSNSEQIEALCVVSPTRKPVFAKTKIIKPVTGKIKKNQSSCYSIPLPSRHQNNWNANFDAIGFYRTNFISFKGVFERANVFIGQQL